MPSSSEAPPIGPVNRVVLSVRDLAASKAWYSTTFGMDTFLTNADTCAIGDDTRFAFLIHPETLLIIGLQQHLDNDGGPFHPAATGLDYVSLTVPDVAALHSWKKRLHDLEVPTGEITEWRHGTRLTLQDPDGIPIELFALKGPPLDSLHDLDGQ